MNRNILVYRACGGASPFEEWLDRLKDVVGRARVRVRIDRAARGNLGDHRSVGAGVIELRIHYGPGYRVYLCMPGLETLLLLCGGDKSTQDQDISLAHRYRDDYERRL